MIDIKSVSVKVEGTIDLLEASEIADAIENLVGEDAAIQFECVASGKDKNSDISINVVIKRKNE